MNGNLNFLFSLSVIFPAIICLLRFQKIKSDYKPFALWMCVALLAELISYYLARRFKTTNAFLNFYSLFESLILVYQFKRWGFLAKRSEKIFISLLTVMVLLWIADNMVFSNLKFDNKNYLIAYSFFVVMLSIRQINQDMMQGRKTLESARLIICTGILLFFTFSTVRETFYAFSSGISKSITNRVHIIVTLSNMIANIVYAFAAYYIPKKKSWPDFFNTYTQQV